MSYGDDRALTRNILEARKMLCAFIVRFTEEHKAWDGEAGVLTKFLVGDEKAKEK